MDSELKRVLGLVQSRTISPEEGRRLLQELKARAATAQPPHAQPAPAPAAERGWRVAVIGLACKLGGARSARELWKNIAGGRCSIREVPAERWDANSIYDPDPRTPGKTNSRWGGFIDDIDAFDPLFFNISGKEAELTDPQQRLFLETCWSALEDAGYANNAVSGARCGVYAGAPASDYAALSLDPDAQVLMGNDTAILSARISYYLNLKGPSVAINTACSSSLVAVHLACQAIESGQCDMALAGGVCIFVTSSFYLSASKAGMLSPDGLCKAFDNDANGFVPGDGVGVVVLKSLDAALRDGDHVYGVVLGADTNQDGKTNGITAPSSLSQTAVQLSAYRKAGINPETISLIEAHGTGTKLGDPVEVEALTRSFGVYTSRKQFCAIGSIKTNVGHTGQAAGVAGLIKTLLAFRHELIPPSLHFRTPNERIAFAETPFHVVTSPIPWPRRPGAPRRAAVSSFGYSGTNAHVVVEEPPVPVAPLHTADPGWHLVLVSAKTDVALAQRLAELRSWLEEEASGKRLEDISYTLHAGRSHFRERAAFVVCDARDLHSKLLHAPGGVRTGGGLLRASEKQEWAERMRRGPSVAELSGDARREALDRLADLYQRGMDIDVELVYPNGRGRRISMPTYPFARERYWVGTPAAAPRSVRAEAQSHPFLSEDRSTDEVACYRFRPAAQPLVRDHAVGGRVVLAAAVSLEMVRAAAARVRSAGVTRIRDVTWRRQIDSSANHDIEIQLRPEGAALCFDIDVSGESPRAPSVTGFVSFEALTTDEPPIELSAVRARCTESLPASACYERFRRIGLEHGPAFRSVRELWRSEAEVLARLELPPAHGGEASEFVLHPALVDGALQSIIGLASDDELSEHYVPYELGELEVRASLPRACYAHLARVGEGVLDIRITDDSGRVLVALRRLAVAPLQLTSSKTLWFRPAWRASELRREAAASGPSLVFAPDRDVVSFMRAVAGINALIAVVPGAGFRRVAGDLFEIDPGSEQDYERLIGSFAPEEVPARILVFWAMADLPGIPEQPPDLTRGFFMLLGMSRALMKLKRRDAIAIRFVYSAADEVAPPHLAALGAFARTLQIEHSGVRLQVIGLPVGAPIAKYWDQILAEDDSPAAIEVRLGADGTRRVKVLEEQLRPDAGGRSPLREGGAYVITGGTGGIGLIIARHLARRGAQLILIGRSALSGRRSAEMARLSELGATVLYERADVTDRAALGEALQRGRTRFGAISGIIHAAGLLRDAFILRKNAAEARDVIGAKLDGAIWLDQITRDDPLDFFVLFSSAVAVLGNVGQADYGFANAALDEFAAAREAARREGKRRGKTLSIDWPAWAGGGMKGAAEIEALTDEEGLNAFEAALHLEGPQVVVLKGDPGAMRDAVATPAAAATAAPRTEPGAGRTDLQPAAEAYLKQLLSEELRVPVTRIVATEPLELYGIDSVMIMRLSRRLDADFGAVPRTLFFEYQTLEELAAYFVERHGARIASKLASGEGSAPSPLASAPASATPSHVEPVGVVGLTPRAADAIAIIGVSGRYPMADDLATFWQNLASGRDCVIEIPPHRWAIDGFYSPEKGKPGKSYSKWGGFLSDIDRFDPLFFNIAPFDADMMDPQERLFLEEVWHLIEDAGYTKASLRNTRTGVFVGVMYGHYQLIAVDPSDGRLPMSSYASIANRVSYFFDFRGPSIALDTMCSSSLTAMHLACESILRGECDVAVAGGVNVSIHPQKYVQLCLGRFAATDGRCRSFGDGGDGYVPGEGVGAVLLKRLSAAIADGDTIHAIVRATAINHGGKTNGYTVPNPHAQGAVIVEAMHRAGINARDVSYIEAHGTGTALGDPIEIAALAKAFGDRLDGERCPIGSVKSSIGHLESAAGIAAITKVLLQMRHGALAPSLHADRLNVNIDFDSVPFELQRTFSEWKRRTARDDARTLPRIAGVSSFGAGGSNAHVILEEYEAPTLPAVDAGPQIIVLSAKTREQLLDVAERLVDDIERRCAPAGTTWRTRFRDDLLRHTGELVGARAGDLGLEDDLRECGLDEVARARLGAMIGDEYRLEWDGYLPTDLDTVAALAEHLADRHESTLLQRYDGPGDARSAAVLAPPRLADIAFTLQIGRECMDERLAFVAHDLGDMLGCLRDIIAGEPQAPDVFVARVGASGDDASAKVFEGAAGEEYLRALIRERALPRIAQLWTQGASFDWRVVHAGYARRRVSLPSYPLARERHWLPLASPALSPAGPREARIEQEQQESRRQEVAVSRRTNEQSGPVTPDGDLRARIVHELKDLAAGLIGLSPERMDPRTSFGDYGFESVALKELAELISARFGVPFQPTSFFERPSLDGIASLLIEDHGDQIQGASLAAIEPRAAEGAMAATERRDRPPREPDSSGGAGAEPIAVVGMSGRFPGARTLRALWENLSAQRDLVTEIPEERWNWRDYDNERLPPDQRCKCHWGGFIEDIDKFDPLFFGISPLEAEMMDPQQRLMLQTTWEAIEDAGYRASDLSGKDVGVFAGVQFSDYQHLLHDAGLLTAQSGIGNEHSIVVNRISYLLNLRGPSEPVNTACSSSLVAVHRAVRSLRMGECSIALAGGIALNLAPYSTEAAAKMGLLSPDGRCKTLDRSANGYVKGEGVGVVMLKPLAAALADGDHVYAVIRGTSVNHGGRAASLTAPSSEAQAALIEAAVEEADVAPHSIGYLELHGTGTELGDPVEINGIKLAFRKLARRRGMNAPEQPHCGIGSIKTNIGHLEPASGIAGMMKVILSIQHGAMPGILHLKELNPYISLKNSPFFVVERTMPWKRPLDARGRALPRRGGVSSFGFGGVNAHVLIEEHVAPAGPAEEDSARTQIIVLSAKTEEALVEAAKALLDRVRGWDEDPAAPSLGDVAYTLQIGREEHRERLACVVPSMRELESRLACFVRDEPAVHVYRGRATGSPATVSSDVPEIMAEQWVDGRLIDWRLLHWGRRPRRVSLPTYQFARKRYWFTAPARSTRPRTASEAPAATPGADEGLDGEVLSGEDYVREELRQILLEKLKLEDAELDEDRNIQDFGADSIINAMIMQAVQDKFGSQVPLSAPAEHPTLRLLARYIFAEHFAGQGRGVEGVRHRSGRAAQVGPGSPIAPLKLPPELLPINPKGTRQPSFWVHGATGHAVGLQNLSDALGPDYPFYAFQARGVDGRAMPQMLDEMVDHYIHCIRLIQPKGPYVIGGYSFGGVVAMEIARKLGEQGETIRHLIMFDTYPATEEVFQRHFGPYDDDFLPLYLVNFFLKIKENPELAVRKSDIAHLPKRLQLARLAQLAKERGNKRMSVDDIFLYLRGGLLCSEIAEGIYQVYQPKRYEASDVLFFKALDGFTGKATLAFWPPTNILGSYDYIQPWRDLVKRDVTLVELDNDHLNMLEDPTLEVAHRAVLAVLRDPPLLDMDQYARMATALDEVTQFGAELLADGFRRAGMLAGEGERVSELRARLSVLQQYDRLFRASLGILERRGWIRRLEDRLEVMPALLSERFPRGEEDIRARAEALASSHPEIKDYLPLLITCQASVFDVMAGRKDAVDVIFPGGAMDLVGELYKGNLQSDFYNRIVAEQIGEHVRQHSRRYKHSKMQIFEVGAGTGGTSAFVLESLAQHAGHVRYLFTDIGNGFVQASKRSLGARYPFVECMVFDAEKPPEEQGFEPRTMDVVLASNVIHVTRRIGATLQQCHRLLRPGGMIVVNEITQRLDYNTLTFGLTTGWWQYEDEENRLPDSPLLDAGQWTRILEQAGFRSVDILGVPRTDPADLSQSVIVARAT